MEGLKKYGRYYELNFDDIFQIKIDLNKSNRNEYIIMNLLNTGGTINPLDCSLIYSNRSNQSNVDFGNKIKLSSYKKVSAPSSTQFNITNPDDSVDTYTYNSNLRKYENKEKHLTATVEEDDYSNITSVALLTLDGCEMDLDVGKNYPTLINKGSKQTTFLTSDSISEINNGVVDKLTFTKTNGLVTKISWLKNSVEIYRVNLAYTNSNLTGITIYRVATSGTVQLKNYTLSYSNGITITNVVSGEVVNILPSTSTTTITRTRGSISLTETISYGTYETIITNALGLKTYYVYDNNDRIVNVIDSSKRVTYTKYDDYLLLEESKPINVLEQTSKSLLTNGFFTNGLNGWTSSYGSCTVETNRTNSSKYFNKMVKIPQSTYLHQNISIEGTSLNPITLVFAYANYEEYDDFDLEAYIGLTPTEGGQATSKTIRFNSNSPSYLGYRFAFLTIKPTCSYKMIQVRFYSYGSSAYIGGVQLLKTDGVVKYTYNDNHILEKIDSLTQHTNLKYKDGRLVSRNINDDYYSRIISGNEEFSFFDYGVTKRVIKDDYEREISTILYNGDDKFITNTTYDSDEVTSEDDGVLSTAYEYNSREKTLKRTINSEGKSTSYSYNNKLLVSAITQGDNSNSYTYDSNDDLDTYKSYDNDYVDGQLSKVKLNNHELASFSYDNKGRIVSESSQGEITTYSYLNDKVSNVTKNGKTITYSYDVNDKVTSISYDGASISYQYDENDNVCLEDLGNSKSKSFYQEGTNNRNCVLSSVNNKHILKNIDLVEKKSYKTYTAFKEYAYSLSAHGTTNNYCCFFDRANFPLINKKIVNGNFIESDIYPLENNLSIERYHERNCVNTTSQLLVYPINDYINKGSNFSFGLLFDVYISSTTPTGSTIFYIGSSKNLTNAIGLKYYYSITDQKYYLALYHRENNMDVILVSSTNQDALLEVSEGWHHVGVYIVQTAINSGYNHVVNLEIDDRVVDASYYDSSKCFDCMNNDSIVSFGGKYNNGTESSKSNVYVSDIMLNLFNSYELIYSTDTLLDLYTLKKKYQEYDNPIDESFKTFTLSGASFIKLSDNELLSYEIYPLNGSFTSLEGKKPYIFDPCNQGEIDERTFFSFNKNTERYQYECLGHYLVYKTTMNQNGTISIGTTIENSEYEKCLFGLKLDNSEIDIVIKDNELKAIKKVDDTTESMLNINVQSGNQRITLTWLYIGSSNFNFSVYKDTTLLGSFTITTSVIPSYSFISIGNDFKKEKPYLGKVYNLVTRAEYVGSIMSSFINMVKEIRISSQYDRFNRKKVEKVVYDGQIYKKIYSYKEYNENSSSFVSSESNLIGTEIDNFAYKYETGSGTSFKNISLLTEVKYTNLDGVITTKYVYDDNNRLKEEIIDGTTIGHTYDSRGNILTKGSNSFTYGSSYLDRLEEINGVSVSYDSTNPYKMLGFGPSTSGLSFIYTGKDITSITNKATGVATSFTYDSFGRRIKKEIDGANKYTEFIYLDGKLEAEIYKDDNTIYYTLRFLYDENDNLFGFYYNDTPYFYLKNALGIIYGIVDQNKNKIVEYSYDAWGKLLSTTSSNTTISNINPFIYKSYYYDKETGLYWLSSRYYNPDWGRFISPDSIEYLDPESINGLNLYAYCNNDPVNKYDPTGHIAISLIVGLVVSFAIGTTASAISQYVQYGEVNLLQAGVDGLFAVASTALAYTGIGLIGSIAAGAGMGLAQYTLDSAVFHDDFSWSGALIATGLGALGGLASGRGAQHFKSIGSNLDDTGRTGVKAILTAFDKYGTGAGYQKVMNLWGGRVANSLAKSISQNFTKSALIIWGTTAASYKASYWLNKIDWGF